MGEYKKNIHIPKILWLAIIIGFAIMEFPGIFFINRIDPVIFGLPFIYGFIIIMWVYMCVILLIAYKTNWGKNRNIKESNKDNLNKKGDIEL